MNELIFAIKEEKLVSIDDVEKGAQCGCTCPCCGEKLTAKKGNIKIHHFAHISGSSCAYGYETSLHRLAKEIIEKLEYIVLPSVKIGYISLFKEYKAKIQAVELEKKYNNIKPDILVKIRNKFLAIEIYVTHKVDFEKIKKVQKDNLAMIEINLRELIKNKEKNNPQMIKELLEQILLSDNDSRKYWVFNNKKEQYIQNNNLRKNVIYYFGKPFVNCCPKISYLGDKKIRHWSNVRSRCKEECINFLELDKTTNSVLCTNKDSSTEIDFVMESAFQIEYDKENEPIINNCPSQPYRDYSLKKDPVSINKCLDCPFFISGNKEFVNCLRHQKFF